MFTNPVEYVHHDANAPRKVFIYLPLFGNRLGQLWNVPTYNNDSNYYKPRDSID